MKKLSRLAIALALTTLLAFTAQAAEKIKAGPKGGRVLEMDGQNAEFVIEKDRTVTVLFYDVKMEPKPAEAQVVTATAEAPSGKVKLDFEKKDGTFVSKAPLPPGEGYRIVVQVRPAADAKPKNFRIPLDLSICGGCDRAEYACTCDH